MNRSSSMPGPSLPSRDYEGNLSYSGPPHHAAATHGQQPMGLHRGNSAWVPPRPAHLPPPQDKGYNVAKQYTNFRKKEEQCY